MKIFCFRMIVKDIELHYSNKDYFQYILMYGVQHFSIRAEAGIDIPKNQLKVC
jgi:hypothetical protein